MRSNDEIIKQAQRSTSIMDFYLVQLEILLDIRTLECKLVESGGIPSRRSETGASEKTR